MNVNDISATLYQSNQNSIFNNLILFMTKWKQVKRKWKCVCDWKLCLNNRRDDSSGLLHSKHHTAYTNCCNTCKSVTVI